MFYTCLEFHQPPSICSTLSMTWKLFLQIVWMLTARAIPEKFPPLVSRGCLAYSRPLSTPGIAVGPHSHIINIRLREPPSTEELITRNTAHEDIIYKISVEYSVLSNYPIPLGHIMQLNISHNKSRVMGFF